MQDTWLNETGQQWIKPFDDEKSGFSGGCPAWPDPPGQVGDDVSGWREAGLNEH